MDEGAYDIVVRGGAAILAVNASQEWLPRQVRIKSGIVRTGTPVGARPRLRDHSWVYALIIAALCAEWLVRRKAGLR
jgi:hypothetical protein